MQRSRVLVRRHTRRFQPMEWQNTPGISAELSAYWFSYLRPLSQQAKCSGTSDGEKCSERSLNFVSASILLVGGIIGINASSCLTLQSIPKENDDVSSKSGILSLKKRGDALSGNTCRDSKFYKHDAAEVLDLSTVEFRNIEILQIAEEVQDMDCNVDKGVIAIAKCGCSVTMEELTIESLKHGYVPQVTPEFRKITVGGAVMGAGVESSSGRFGEFSETCRSVTLRLADGRVVKVMNPSDSTRRKHNGADSDFADLFDALSGSYGSLATLLHAEIKLMQAKPHVQLSYFWYGEGLEDVCTSDSKQPSSLDRCAHALTELSQSHDFAEALSFIDDTHCIITADFTDVDVSMSQVNTITSPEDLWFYEHVRETKHKYERRAKEMDNTRSENVASANYQEIISTVEYLHRHERGAFWMARPEGEIEHCLLLQGRIFGWILDLLSRKGSFFRGWPCIDECWKTGYLFRLLRSLPQAIGADNFLITDIYTDVQNVVNLVGLVREWGGAIPTCPYKLNTPIWLCPIRVPFRQQLLSPHGHRGGEKGHCRNIGNQRTSSLVLVDVGLYGRVLPSAGGCGDETPATALDAAKFFEKWGLENNARKMLYSLNFYAEERDFWEYRSASDNSANSLDGVKFNKTAYDNLRNKYGAEGRLPDLYTKVGNSEPRVENSRSGLRYWMWSFVAALT